MSVGKWPVFIVLIFSLSNICTELTKLYCSRHRFSAIWRSTLQLIITFFIAFANDLPFRTARSNRHLTARNARRRPAAAAAIADRLLPLCRALHRVGRAAARRVSIPALTVQDLASLADDEHDATDPPFDAHHFSHARRSSPICRSTFRSVCQHAARALHSHACRSLSHVLESPRADRPAPISEQSNLYYLLINLSLTRQPIEIESIKKLVKLVIVVTVIANNKIKII